MNNCPNCQYKSPRSRAVAFLLSLLIFCGFAGVHRIYAGKVITGIIQFATFGLCGLWQLLDMILIICGAFEDKEGKVI